MGLTGFNRQRRRAMLKVIDDERIADKLIAHGVNEPGKLKRASAEELSFLSEKELKQLKKGGNDAGSEEKDMTVSEIKDKIVEIDTVEALKAVLEEEKAGKNRKTAVAAIQGRIDELSEEEPENEDPEADADPETEAKGDAKGAEGGEEEEEDESDSEKEPEGDGDKEPEPDKNTESDEGGDADPADENKADPASDNTFENLPEGTEFPYGYGGGMFFLSDGTKVKGRKAAENTQKQLDAHGG